jgi:hypothetical protein
MYVKLWVRDIDSNPKINLLNVRDSMLPNRYSHFALNDVVLELSLFLDEEPINRVETQLITQKLRREWALPSDFQVIETRNKEIGLVINELEELVWRVAGVFDQKDTNTLIKMFSINRNQDTFDKSYYPQDLQSMKDFLNDTACFDDKHKLLEEWVVRKEEEIKQRANLAPKKFQKSDTELHKELDRKMKEYREKMVLLLLNQESKDASATKVNRRYEHLTT